MALQDRMIGSDHGDSTSSEDAFEAGRPRVLFLCSRNAARSQIAEALLFNLLGAEVVVASAGATPAMEVDPMTFDVLDDFGIEWRSHRPRRFSEVMASRWDVVITLCGNRSRG